MNIIDSFGEFNIYPLTKELAKEHMQGILEALDLIPMVDKHNEDDVLLEKTGERVFHAKWEHSLIALTLNGDYAGVIIGYEREKEENLQYPENSIYISSFAISNRHQKKGLGKFLCATWLEYNKKKGFLELEGKLKFTVQTNKAEWNSYVQRIYESLGFKKTAEKKYENRTDNIYSLNLEG